MRNSRRVVRTGWLVFVALGLVFACGYDDTLREYLDVRFWLPYSKKPSSFVKKNTRRISVPYAGMSDTAGDTPLARLRAGYRVTSDPEKGLHVSQTLRLAVAAARADTSLTASEREEVNLIDAKIEMREEEADDGNSLEGALKKLRAFLQTARFPEFRSEARGWLGHIYYLQGNQSAALATNPHWDKDDDLIRSQNAHEMQATYVRINDLLQRHRDLLKSTDGSSALAILAMRTALRMGDPPGALKIAEDVSAAAVHDDPDFNWMLASALFLTHEYASAEQPLLNVFRSSRSSPTQKASAAYGLCGVYQKVGNVMEQIHFALWLHAESGRQGPWDWPTGIVDQTIYWAVSGFDLGLLLDTQASIDQITDFLSQYPDVPHVRLVRYALAVRLSREDRYDEAGAIYESINQTRRAPRMRQLAVLHSDANRPGQSEQQTHQSMYRMAQFISANPDGIYFNDSLWHQFQRDALISSTDTRLTRSERDSLMAGERKLKDEQEERWRAYLLLRTVVDQEGKTDLGRQAAQLAIRCLLGISERFGRQEEIRKAETELSRWLRQ